MTMPATALHTISRWRVPSAFSSATPNSPCVDPSAAAFSLDATGGGGGGEEDGARAAQVAALYKPADFPHIEYALGAAAGDAGTVCSTFALAGQMAAHYPTSAYEFADRTTPPFKSLGPPQPLPPGYQPGAFHTSELQFILGYKAAMRDLDAAQRTRGDAMIRLWVGLSK